MSRPEIAQSKFASQTQNVVRPAATTLLTKASGGDFRMIFVRSRPPSLRWKRADPRSIYGPGVGVDEAEGYLNLTPIIGDFPAWR